MQQQFRPGPPDPEVPGVGVPPSTAAAEQLQQVDDLLADIGEVLQEEATAFVSGFVQKGGQ